MYNTPHVGEFPHRRFRHVTQREADSRCRAIDGITATGHDTVVIAMTIETHTPTAQRNMHKNKATRIRTAAEDKDYGKSKHSSGGKGSRRLRIHGVPNLRQARPGTP